jgi:hypothetical protein
MPAKGEIYVVFRPYEFVACRVILPQSFGWMAASPAFILPNKICTDVGVVAFTSSALSGDRGFLNPCAVINRRLSVM